MKMFLVVLLACVAPAASGQPAVPGEAPENPPFKEAQVLPADEAAHQPDFLEFRKQLIAAVAKRDRASLIEHLADDVSNELAGVLGLPEFISFYGLTGKTDTGHDESFIWEELKEILALGGTFRDGAFHAPYLTTQFPDEFDAFEFAVITGKDVNVRQGPGTNTRVVAKKSYTIVRVLDWGDSPEATLSAGEKTYGWVRVGLPTGETGYVYGKYVRSPIACRAIFQKRGGAWKLAIFVCGD
ncbi:MAG: SH3 domain-containing protein [Candidatus Hydrogenedentes bacterium]|nr:SH3 domain-containing protein [Candidatus Hydrogenedentota bacterium]